MDKMILLFLMLASLSNTANHKDAEWKSYSTGPVGMQAGGAVLCEDKVYCVGGVSSVNSLNLVYECNMSTLEWTKKASLQTGRMNLAVVSAGNKIYAMGGDTFSDVNEVYDPVQNQWSYLAPMPTPCQHVKGVVVNGKIYVMGGLESWMKVSDKNQVYDIQTDTWTQMAPMPIGKHNYSVVAHEDKIYVFGGGVYDDSIESEGDRIWGSNGSIEVYDTLTDKWESLGDMPTSLFYGGIAAYDDKVIIVGGFRGASVDGREVGEGRVDIFSLETHTWSVGAPLPKSNVALNTVVYKDQLYAFGGADPVKNWIPDKQVFQIKLETLMGKENR